MSERLPTARTVGCVLHWGDPSLTARCVESLVAQTPEVPIVVVDNGAGSTPPVGSRVNLVRTAKNLGYTGGMNAGLRWAIARGFEFAILLTNDGWFEDPASVASLVEDLRLSERTAACGPRFFHRGANGVITEWDFPTRNYPRQAPEGSVPRPIGLPSALTDAGHLGGSCLAMRVAAVEDVGLFDERLFMYFDEVDWCYRALIRGWYLCRDDRVSYFEDVSASSSLVRGLKEYYMTRNRLVLSRRYRGTREVARATVAALRRAAGLAKRRDGRWRWVGEGIIDYYRNSLGAKGTLFGEPS